MQTKGSVFIKILLITAIVVVANLLFSRFSPRLDFTGDKRYTLSPATLDVLKELDQTVSVTGHFTEDVPAQFKTIKEDFENLLIEYSNRSGGNVVYNFVNPNESEETEVKTQQEGIRPIPLNVRERDKNTQQRVYLGAKLEYGENASETIPLVDPNGSMEYELTSRIKKMASKNKPKVGIITNGGASGLAAMPQAKEQLDILYEVKDASLTDSLQQYEVLMLLAPKDSFTNADLAALDNYLAQGKGLVLALNRVNINQQTGQGEGINTGLEIWLEQKGIQIKEEFAIDVKCGAISVPRQQGPFTFNTQVNFPYFVLASNFKGHPVTNGVEQVTFPFVSSITYTGKNNDVIYTPLVLTSAQSGAEAVPVTFDINKPLQGYNYYTSGITLASALEGKLSNGNGLPTKMVVFGDGDFAVNGQGEQAQRLSPDNINLLCNAVDWMADDSGLKDLRTKIVTARPLDAKTDAERRNIKAFNFVLPIGLILLYGIIRSQMRKSRKRRWQNERYV